MDSEVPCMKPLDLFIMAPAPPESELLNFWEKLPMRPDSSSVAGSGEVGVLLVVDLLYIDLTLSKKPFGAGSGVATLLVFEFWENQPFIFGLT